MSGLLACHDAGQTLWNQEHRNVEESNRTVLPLPISANHRLVGMPVNERGVGLGEETPEWSYAPRSETFRSGIPTAYQARTLGFESQRLPARH